MNPNEELINKFYTAFKNKDADTMISCYHDDIEFSDPVFQNLKGISAKAMWKMLLERSKDLEISFNSILADDTSGKANWEAIYTFSKTNRKIHNKIAANFGFKDGKIIKHTDKFNLWKWSAMALGLPGLFLGFTSKVQNKIREEANTGLEMYMKRKKMK